MNKEQILKSVLTVGCRYKPPRGGIAQVLWNYDNYVFEDFKFIENSRKSNLLTNVFVAFLAMIKMTFKLLLDKQIKIVHIHTASENGFKRSSYFLRLSKLFNKKVIMHIHGGGFKDYYNSNKRFVDKNLEKCDKIITLSQEWVDYYSSIGFESYCVENVIPEPKVHPQKHTDGLLHMLYLGLIVERKGIYDLLDVLKEHKKEFEGKVMLHIGGNGEVEQLANKITSFCLENIVKYEGWVDNDKKVKLLNMCDVFVLPSYVEGLPLSILEAMSYDLAIIASKIGGIPSIVKNNVNGILVEPKNRNSLHDAIWKILYDNDFRIHVSNNNSKYVQNFYPHSVTQKLVYLYNSLL